MMGTLREYTKVLELIISTSVILLTAAVLAGCESGAKMQTELPVAYSSTPQVFDLSLEEKLDLERKANLGDNEAALRLNEYYALTIVDPEQGVPYLLGAINRGSVKAMWILAAHFESGDGSKNCEAIALYEKLSVTETQEVERENAILAKAALQAKVGVCP